MERNLDFMEHCVIVILCIKCWVVDMDSRDARCDSTLQELNFCPNAALYSVLRAV